jgi:hypothetical protein
MNSKIHIKIQIKTLKMLLHVSILRSSSGSIHCSLLKLYIKPVSKLLRYINLVMWQHVVCWYVHSTLCRESLSLHKVVVVVVIVLDQGPEPRLQLHCSQLGLLYTLFSRSTHCRRQMSPRPTRGERSEQREVELNGRERVAENFA